MAAAQGRLFNPELEKVRQDALQKHNIKEQNITEILKGFRTKPKIHAAYLYYTQNGRLLRQKLCRLLSGIKSTNFYSNWEDFGIELGLEPILIEDIKHSMRNEDPSSNVLLAFAQKDNATIESIAIALYELKLYHILSEIQDMARTTCTEILKTYASGNLKDMIKPATLPICPFILKNLNNLNEKCTKITPNTIGVFSNEAKNKQKRYARTILLTYTNDADDVVQELLNQLRKPKGDLKLGVVLLNEQRHCLHNNSEQFIFECFAQVDYVFPIITQQYLKQVVKETDDISTYSALKNPDHKYVKYIYRLMNTHYLRNGCKNVMVRCIIPDCKTSEILKHPIMNHSLLQVWIRASEINELIDAILKSEI